MATVIEGLVLTLLILLAVQVYASLRARREDRREQLLRESWAIYQASRRIHDKTTVALQAMLDEARVGRSDGP